ncbi:Aste57867_1140 [Aphanomyces stellatus]|uniref:Aste57867_1140 protein n=1 Tax=Aphanomyces stellatus TaxID=120398 RepID=A0A485K4W8_9STRA|nr:hypothetical protein As57867_001139 [Aphanomyces stellatus]VFT78360.1 Aste57867_1140 [Aphanomyces stellatus]
MDFNNLHFNRYMDFPVAHVSSCCDVDFIFQFPNSSQMVYCHPAEPRPNDPSFNHQYATINGIRMHFIDVGPRDALPIVLVHGFPDTWWGWRNQIQVLRATYRVIVADNRGFGETESPANRHCYGRKTIAQDYASLLDHLDIPKAVFVGHDWGADFVWKMCLFQPERVVAVAAFCSPYLPRAPAFVPLQELAQVIPSLQYQLFFNQPNTPALLDLHVDKLLKLMFKVPLVRPKATFTENVMDVHALAFAADAPTIMSSDDFEFYVAHYRKSGFTGPLNWYKVLDLDWRDMAAVASSVITHPALFVAAGQDVAIPLSLSAGMEKYVPNLTRVVVEDASHWILWDSPDQVNHALVDWLAKITYKVCG